ncbi:hypothetical protein [Streptomyces daliensis]
MPEAMTDEELRALDVPMTLRYGLTLGGAHRTALFGDGAVAAALQAEELGVLPRALSFLGEVVRRDGLRPAAELPEPLPGEAAGPAREWLGTAVSVLEEGDLDGEESVARWLEAAAALLELRRSAAPGTAKGT